MPFSPIQPRLNGPAWRQGRQVRPQHPSPSKSRTSKPAVCTAGSVFPPFLQISTKALPERAFPGFSQGSSSTGRYRAQLVKAFAPKPDVRRPSVERRECLQIVLRPQSQCCGTGTPAPSSRKEISESEGGREKRQKERGRETESPPPGPGTRPAHYSAISSA